MFETIVPNLAAATADHLSATENFREISLMPTVIHHEELVRRALAYILERKQEDPDSETSKLLDSAGARYNLSPLDQQALEHMLAAVSWGGAEA